MIWLSVGALPGGPEKLDKLIDLALEQLDVGRLAARPFATRHTPYISNTDTHHMIHAYGGVSKIGVPFLGGGGGGGPSQGF